MTKKRRYSSSQFAQRKRRQKRIKIILWSLFILTTVFGLSYWSGHKSVTINSIEISESRFIENEDIINTIESVINSRYLGLFSRRNFLLLPRNEIKSKILENNFAVSSVELRLQGRNILNVEMVEHDPVAKWCGFRSDDVLDNCYLVNNEGLIYARDNLFNPYGTIRLFGVHESSENIIGQKYADSEFFNNLKEFILGLEEMEIEVVFVETLDEETFAIQAFRGPYLLIAVHNDPETILNNLKIVIESEDINPAQFRNLEYIDLRFGNRVFYRIR